MRDRHYRDYFIGSKHRFGFSYHFVHTYGQPYLERWIIWLGWITLRFHRFVRSDDDRALHDHPFWFVTFPFGDYREIYWDFDAHEERERIVKAWRFHFRPAKHRHIVKLLTSPSWTFVVSSNKINDWGFWPSPDTFVPWREWDAVGDDYRNARNTNA